MKKFSLLLVGLLICFSGRAFAASASADIKATKAGSAVEGKVRFEETAEGLKVTAQVSNATPGKHGFHIHENDACGEEGKAAGGHFNPDGVPHGFITKDGVAHAHAGDLGNIDIDASGNGKLEIVVPALTLTGDGKYNVSGKSVILHEKVDDFGQPTGNAGGRIGCGVIQLSNEK